MNWKLGLFRLWLVASIIWVGAVMLNQRPWEQYEIIKWDDGTSSNGPPLPHGACRVAQDPWKHPNQPCMPYNYWPQIRITATDALLPPFATLALAFAGLWVLRGFKKSVSEG